ncbi:sensor histidine kinase [Hymenobacter sp. BT491]|uniref:sensor histidine kinase n=1 Tax=Hymenobacter sp. BT491 TaxID=2766779 RepID=UPI001653EA96|nr:histidine kinase [Hymenobacter sp. BT491]MBC6992215.1 histidine kinase [Hymenobacter sp. BT491]
MLKLEKIKWGRVALAWALFTVFMVALVYAQALTSGTRVPWRTAVLGPLVYGGLWTLLTPVVFWLAARFDLTAGRRRMLPYALVHVGSSVALTAVFRTLYVALLYLLAVPGTVLSWAAILSSVNVWVPGYWMLLGVAYALDFSGRYQRRNLDAARLEVQLVHAQLQALKMQLQPHFLFNTLNAIATLIGDDPQAAQRMTAKLGAFLRLILDHTDEQQIPLAQELQFTGLYLDMEQIRFADRLAITYELDPAALPALVPNLLLQPLVENAVKHGLASATGAGAIHIQAERQGERLVLHVRDNGPGTDRTGPRGIGLRNSEDRLRALYGAYYALTIHTAPAQGFAVRIELPYQPHS